MIGQRWRFTEQSTPNYAVVNWKTPNEQTRHSSYEILDTTLLSGDARTESNETSKTLPRCPVHGPFFKLDQVLDEGTLPTNHRRRRRRGKWPYRSLVTGKLLARWMERSAGRYVTIDI